MEIMKFNSMEEAWKKATEEGYNGTLEEFSALCDKVAEEVKLDEKLDVEEMDAVAGGGFVEAMETVGGWIEDNAVLVGTVTAGIAACVASVVIIRKGQKDFENQVHNFNNNPHIPFLEGAYGPVGL